MLDSVLNPLSGQSGLAPAHVAEWDFLIVMAAAALVINGVTLLRLRVWNPSRSFGGTVEETKPVGSVPDEMSGTAAVPAREKARSRRIWANPVIWREIARKRRAEDSGH